ncbi:MAG: fasciclin domain-containing protein [Haliea sp.]|uniref:fasciclin domain-containing protein n=1 Tax=Haliea sp. TaxID=1932666 RepID=UPI0032ED7672
MNIATRFLALLTLCAGLIGAGAASAGHHSEGEMTRPNIVEVAAGNDDFSTLVAAIQAAGLAEVLAGEGPFTVFAPTNAAFAKLPAGTLDTLLDPANKQQLVDILTYHVVAGKVYASDVVKLTTATTVNGADVSVKTSETGVQINSANVITTDIKAGNGVIHVIDTVILPGA